MTTARMLWRRFTRRLPDPDVSEARRVADETTRITAKIGRTLLDIEAQGWAARDQPLDMTTMVQDARRSHD